MQELVTTFIDSPLGTIQIVGTDKGVRNIQFAEKKLKSDTGLYACITQCTTQLGEYFERRKTEFHTFDLAIQGTDFQQKVWSAAMEVPYGETASYAEIAKTVGSPDAARAVGTALGSNRLLLVIPCHRILPSTGTVGEFAAGSWRKKWLLEHEQV